ncbi:expressed unknown protein [Seminavis robusta]|uniref:Uncharacterized protein n=1 Tax=Seminavis robusta TaxID=568900 RepID=A0A9N8EZU3_9STRA|nr:expressed unknown protein [Seminavis robusta]|eukprot:Sro2062_g313060.1 n/a (98) ;mRNA; f:10146-10532
MTQSLEVVGLVPRDSISVLKRAGGSFLAETAGRCAKTKYAASTNFVGSCVPSSFSSQQSRQDLYKETFFGCGGTRYDCGNRVVKVLLPNVTQSNNAN